MFNPNRTPKDDKIERGFHLVLEGLREEYGIDPADDNFSGTPRRIAKAYREIFSGWANTEGQVTELLKTAFPCPGSGGMILETPIRVHSMCPHHFLPVELEVSVAYIPQAGGKVLGLSKLPRLVELMARRAELQESLGEDVTRSLMSLRGCLGAACLVRGRHFCMIMRGVRQLDTWTTTSSLKGVFLEESAARNEFLTLAGRK